MINGLPKTFAQATEAHAARPEQYAAPTCASCVFGVLTETIPYAECRRYPQAERVSPKHYCGEWHPK